MTLSSVKDGTPSHSSPRLGREVLVAPGIQRVPLRKLGDSQRGLNNAPEGRAPAVVALAAVYGLNGTTASETNEWLAQVCNVLCTGTTLEERVSAAQILKYPLPRSALNRLQVARAASDLVQPQNSPAARKAGLDLIQVCLRPVPEASQERQQFFCIITCSVHPDDFYLQFAALKELSANGLNLNGFELLIAPLLTQWLYKLFEASQTARQLNRKNRIKTDGGSVVDGDNNLQQLFCFLNIIIQSSVWVFDEDNVVNLVKQLLSICKTTTTVKDARNVLILLESLVMHGHMPASCLLNLVSTLCNVYYSVEELRAEDIDLVEKLCLHQNETDTISAILKVMRASDGSDFVRRGRRGAVLLMSHLLQNHEQKKISRPSISLVLDAFESMNWAQDPSLYTTLCSLLKTILDDSAILKSLFFVDWQSVLRLLPRLITTPYSRPNPENRRVANADRISRVSIETSTSGLSAIEETSEADTKDPSLPLLRRMETLIMTTEFVARDEAIDILLQTSKLSNSTVECIIEYFVHERLSQFSGSNWQEDSEILANLFVRSGRPAEVRLKALEALRGVYHQSVGIVSEESLKALVVTILGSSHSESDLLVHQAMVSFLVEVADSEYEILFNWVIECLQTRMPPTSSLAGKRSAGQSSAGPIQSTIEFPGTSFEGLAANGLAHMFAQTLSVSPARAVRIFDILIDVSKSEQLPSDARIAAMQVLLRLRADADDRVYLICDVDCATEAAYLARNQPMSESRPRETAVDGDRISTRSLNQNISSARQSLNSGPRIGDWTEADPLRPKLLWVYPEILSWAELAISSGMSSRLRLAHSTSESSQVKSRQNSVGQVQYGLRVSEWLFAIISSIQNTDDWDVRSYLLVHLGAQLSNVSLFKYSKPGIAALRSVVYQQIVNASFKDPPKNSGVRKTDVALCVYHIATNLVPHHHVFGKNEQETLVRALVTGIGAWDSTSRICVQALTICCFELPNAVSKNLGDILQKLAQIITQSHLAVHVLEFLALLARRSDIYSNFGEREFLMIFGISFKYLHHVVDQRYTKVEAQILKSKEQSWGASGLPSPFSHPQRRDEEYHTLEDLPQYIYALAYHVVTFWFMCLRLQDRIKYTTWIIENLVARNPMGQDIIDDQSEVTIDMLHRITFSDVDELLSEENWAAQADGKILTRSWIQGHSVITVETATTSGLTKLTRREPSGTSHYLIHNRQAPLRSHQHGISLADDRETEEQPRESKSKLGFLPNHIFMQFIGPSIKSNDPEAMPVKLPEDERTDAFLRNFDRNPTVDSHKIGVIYIGDGQTEEADILANNHGSEDYALFLERLGVLVRIKDADFNTQGLDRAGDTDGKFTVCWRDRVTELIFHVATLMPTDRENDPLCTQKKKHIGNDYVNIIFNDSGQPIDFDTFPSDFNFVNILITPEIRLGFTQTRMRTHHEISRQMFRVEVRTKGGMPDISSVADGKMVSMSTVPALVRLLAINASVFALVWANRDGGEHVSSWRSRLRMIKDMRRRYGVDERRSSSASSGGGEGPMSSVSAAAATAPPLSSISQTISNAVAPFTFSRRASTAFLQTDTRTPQDKAARMSGFTGAPVPVDFAASIRGREPNGDKPEDGTRKVVRSLDFARWAT